MLEDLFRNRLSPLQPVFPQADWQRAAGDVSGMPAAGRVKPPPARRATTTGLVARPGQAADVQAGTSVCAKAARSSDSPSPWQHCARGTEPLQSTAPAPRPQPVTAELHRLGQQQPPWCIARSFGEVGAQEAWKEPEMKPHQPRRLVQEASRWQQHLALCSQNCQRWEWGSSCPAGPALGESSSTGTNHAESSGISDIPRQS